MPIMFKGMTGPELLSLLEIPPDDAKWLGANGFKVQVFATEIRLSNGKLQAATPCKMDHLVQLKAGTAGPILVKQLRMQMVGAIKSLKKGMGEAYPGVVTGTFEMLAGGDKPPAQPASGIMAVLAKNKPKPLQEHPPEPTSPPFPAGYGKVVPATKVEEPSTWSQFPLPLLGKAVPVPLSEANQMYQPVRGSSSGSRYFLVGANDDLRVACRYISKSLSIRIEGPGYAKHKDRIHACGVTGGKSDYASIHLNVDDHITAAKALGAVLLGIGITLETPLPDLMLLHNKGT